MSPHNRLPRRWRKWSKVGVEYLNCVCCKTLRCKRLKRPSLSSFSWVMKLLILPPACAQRVHGYVGFMPKNTDKHWQKISKTCSQCFASSLMLRGLAERNSVLARIGAYIFDIWRIWRVRLWNFSLALTRRQLSRQCHAAMPRCIHDPQCMALEMYTTPLCSLQNKGGKSTWSCKIAAAYAAQKICHGPRWTEQAWCA